MKYLIFGGYGALGEDVFNKLQVEGHTIVRISRDKAGLDSNSKFIDLTDEKSLIEINLEGYDRILYLAQSRNYKDPSNNYNEIMCVNHRAPILLAEKAFSLSIPFLYASTGSVYENSASALQEEDPVRTEGPQSLYVTSKIATEMKFRELPNVKMIRPFYMFGKKSRVEMLIPAIMEKVKKDMPIHIGEGGGFHFNPISTMDAAEATVAVFQGEHKIVNIAGDEVITIEHLAKLIGEVIYKIPKIEKVKEPSSQSIADIRKLTSLGFQFKYGLNQRIIDFVKAYKN